jgi:hypothetical protein
MSVTIFINGFSSVSVRFELSCAEEMARINGFRKCR